MGGVGVGLGGQSGCERRIEVFVKIRKKKIGGGRSGAGRWGGRWGVGVGVGVELGGQSRCERRIEIFVKIKKKIFFGGERSGGGRWGVGGGVRVDVNEELKVLCKFKKKWGGVGGGVVGLGGGSGWM